MRTQETELFPERRGASRAYLATIALVAALIAALSSTWSDAVLGPRSAHMAFHIVTMNAIAPLAAISWARVGPVRGFPASDRALIVGLILQIGVLYAWHLPGVVGTGEGRPFFHAAMHLALLGSAFLFWAAILSLEEAALWRAVMALILTGKLACLLGVLLLLAPRLLDDSAGAASEAALDDQRFAGLIMLAACPLFYVATAVHITTKWLNGVEAGAARLCDRKVMKPG